METTETTETTEPTGNPEFIAGQKLAFATAALLLGIASFISLLGVEKGILAIAFACMALRTRPAPRLEARRGWAVTGLVLGAIFVILVPTVVLIFHERVVELIEALEKLQ